MKQKIVLGITGASGSVYAKVLLDQLVKSESQIGEIGLIFSDNAKDVWRYELGNEDFLNYPFKIYEKDNFFAPFASGSAKYDSLIICPCSMGTMGRIAGGISNDLLTRTADVILKERRKLILVLRDTPFNLIHIQNMKTLTEAGAIICPANPSFYSKPKTMEDLAMTVVSRVLDLAGLNVEGYRWGES